ncbi:EAL and GGDEF domain-containing protein [Cellulomonas endophytica]|uniref:sensor domain-containing protein n=1 Tax=Cellulomonas endophytica TaxID=2494735 RepID=UPI001010E236|nr:EAL domain-containing protein [Cellulomonas endophytica]
MTRDDDRTEGPAAPEQPVAGDRDAAWRLLGRTGAAVVVVDEEHVVRWANPAAAVLHGEASPEVLVGRSVLGWVPAQGRETLREVHGRVLVTGSSRSRFGVLRRRGRPDESVRTVDGDAVAVVWEGLPAVGVVMVDVTDVQAAEAAREAARRPAAVLAEAEQGYLEVCAEGVVLAANAAVARLVGRADPVGARLAELVVPADRPRAQGLVDLVGPGAPAADGGRVLTLRLRRPDGTGVPCRVAAVAVREREGLLDHVALTVLDDREAQDRLEGLAGRADRADALLRALPDAVIVTGPEGRVVETNSQAEALLGYGPGELVGQGIEVLVPAPARDDHRRKRERYGASDHSRSMFTGPGLDAVRRDGTHVPVEVNLAGATLDGRRVVVAAVRDTSEQRRLAERLQASHDLMAGVLAAATEQAVLAVDLEGRIELFSRGAERLLGYSADEVLGRSTALFDVPDVDRPGAWGPHETLARPEAVQALVERDVSATRPWAWRTRTGERHDLLLSLTVRRGATGPDGLIVVATDRTAQLAQEAELAASRERFRVAFEHAPVGVAMVSTRPEDRGRFLQVNGTMTGMLGYGAPELVGTPVTALVHPQDVALVDAGLSTLADGRTTTDVVEHRCLHADGHDVWVSTSFAGVQDEAGRPDYAVCMMTDVTDRRRVEAELVHHALHDALTGLPNRALVTEHLGQALGRARRQGSTAGLLYIDLDNFKDVNDSLGHAAGDELLAAVAERLTAAVRDADVPGRLGGDEFVVVCEDVGDADGIAAVADRVSRALAAQLTVEGRTLQVSASIGVAYARSEDASPADLLREADTAMYRAKANGRGRWEFSDPGLQARALRQIELEADLRAALLLPEAPPVPSVPRADPTPDAGPEGQLYLDYQPCFDARTQRLVACEALLRWRHPQQGLLGPGAFLDVAEERALMVPLGEWVLRAALRQAARWRRRFGDDAPEMWVNVSPGQMARDHFPLLVGEVLDEEGLPGTALVVELTENQALRSSPQVLEDLHALGERGVRLAIDDFGTGYAGMEYLRRLPVSSLKLDRSYVAGLGKDVTGTALAATVVALGRALGLTVVAEGIETPEQHDAVRRLGVDVLQGFLLARPGPAEQVERLLLAPVPTAAG